MIRRKFTARARIVAAGAFALVFGSSLPAQSNPPAPVDTARVDMILRVGIGTLNSGRYADAELAFRKLLETVPCHPQGVFGLADVYFRQGLNDEAVRATEGEAEKCGSRADTLQVFGDILLRTNKKENDERAIATYQRALEVPDTKANLRGTIYFHMAEIYRRKNDREAWNKSLEQASAILKDDPAVMVARGVYQATQGQNEAALSTYRQAIKLDPRNAQALNNIAYLMAEMNLDMDQALQYARRARDLLPESVEVADTLGWIYTRKRWADVAIMLLKAAFEKDPSNEGLRRHLVEALDLKAPSPVLEELKTALRATPSPQNDDTVKQLLLKVAK